MPFCKVVNKDTGNTDANSDQLAVINLSKRKALMVKFTHDILLNEYISILVAHKLFPQAVIRKDNKPAVCLFSRGKLPPSVEDYYGLFIFLLDAYRSPIVVWVPSENNYADRFSRFSIIN